MFEVFTVIWGYVFGDAEAVEPTRQKRADNIVWSMDKY
jgi:hypothetical protein